MASYPPPPPPGYGPPPGPYGGYQPMKTTNGKAIAALVCGIASLTTCLAPLAVAAVILAPMAKREIAAEPGRYEGTGLAQAGQIIGWITITLTVVALAVILVAIVISASTDSDGFESLAALAS